ncbi:MAG: hypothetical protein IPH04_10115 [Saprospirales bacterium]|jgi:hypothetical protein|nr:hypothetical protein [Saprospirales bacterium]MBK7334694.1 hypothetical protein [Saprospirales bacterium]
MELKQLQADLKSRIAKGLNFGMEGLEDVIDPSADTYNEYILLKSKYNDLMYVSSMNTLPYEQIEIGMDRLRTNVLGLIDRLGEGSLKKDQVDPELKVHALPTRRTNFFKLLDIHFLNLEAVSFVQIYSNEEKRTTGREALVMYYQSHQRRAARPELGEPGKEFTEKVKTQFFEFYKNETGMLEVYFKNIRHLLAYSLESEIEQQFFLDTLKSLFSRYEMALIFYYAFCGIDPGFTELVKKGKLLDDSFMDILFDKAHFKAFFSEKQ